MNQPRVTWCPPVNPQRSAPRFDRVQFDDRSRFLTEETALSYADIQSMRVGRVADLTKGRRLDVPIWAVRDELLQGVILKCLENRFYVRNQQGTSTERLNRCRRAARRNAVSKRKHLEARIGQFRALAEHRFADLKETEYQKLFCESLAGRGAPARLSALEKNIRNLDGEVFVAERAPELLAAILYQYFRLGHNSPTIAEALMLTPCQVRQTILRTRRVAERIGPRTRVWLSRAKAEEIRRLAATGTPWEEVAAKFGVVRDTVSNIVQGKTWSGRRGSQS